MTTPKKRILFVNEASFVASGFGTYGKEVLNRLYDTGKYELAELAGYGIVNDPNDKNIRWRYYPNAVRPDDPRAKEYHAHPSNVFGYWRFDRVLLDFKPDIVMDPRDYWMQSFERHSPYRPYFHLVWMPTVDSAPQREEWIDSFIKCDGILTYSDWALKVLEEQSGGTIKLFKSAPPCANPNHFRYIRDKQQARLQFGLEKDINLIGTVMRNQKRKLFPDLFDAFCLFLQKCKDRGQEELAQKTYLYCHTSYPDMGWNIPNLLKHKGLGNKVLFTYLCQSCKGIFPAFFKDARTICPFCHSNTALLPNVGVGVPSEALGNIMGLFDLYIQYAICEGFGLPQVEAAACGVPIAAVDYSAMSDIVRKLDGYPIKVERMFRELETDADRAYPDNDHCAEIIYKFLTMSPEQRKRKSDKTYKLVQQQYTWDRTAKVWEEYFDSVELTGLQGKWDAPLRHQEPEKEPPKNCSNEEFIIWLYNKVLYEPWDARGYIAMYCLRELNYGHRMEAKKMVPVTREQYIDRYTQMQKNKNMCELARCGKIPISPQDFIEYAHMKEKLHKGN